MFGGNFAPAGWAFCNGQLLSITQNEPLFALIGTQFGGDGINTFGLPDLRGRVALGTAGTVPIGTMAGSETVTLLPQQLGSHTHPAVGSGKGNAQSPAGNYWGEEPGGNVAKYSTTAGGQMAVAAIGNAPGGGQPHENMQPYLVISFIIALDGIYPPVG
jgi:microcystin-dependent protein